MSDFVLTVRRDALDQLDREVEAAKVALDRVATAMRAIVASVEIRKA